MTIKIISYNIHKGLSVGNRYLTLQKIKTALDLMQPDIIFLQEVVGKNSVFQKKFSSWTEKSQYTYLAGENWPFSCYGKNSFYPHGHHGNAVLSKFPIVHQENHNISTNRLEKRGLLHSIIKLSDNNLAHCFCLHLDLTNKGRRVQFETISTKIKKLVKNDEKIILAGDFNDWTKEASTILAKELGLVEAFKIMKGKYARTFPAFYPLLSLDRIYFRGFSATYVEVMLKAEWKILSDHLAIYAELI